jgi:hypothetical protein
VASGLDPLHTLDSPVEDAPKRPDEPHEPLSLERPPCPLSRVPSRSVLSPISILTGVEAGWSVVGVVSGRCETLTRRESTPNPHTLILKFPVHPRCHTNRKHPVQSCSIHHSPPSPVLPTSTSSPDIHPPSVDLTYEIQIAGRICPSGTRSFTTEGSFRSFFVLLLSNPFFFAATSYLVSHRRILVCLPYLSAHAVRFYADSQLQLSPPPSSTKIPAPVVKRDKPTRVNANIHAEITGRRVLVESRAPGTSQSGCSFQHP